MGDTTTVGAARSSTCSDSRRRETRSRAVAGRSAGSFASARRKTSSTARRERRIERDRARDRRVQVRERLRRGGVAVERPPPGEELERDHAEGVAVARGRRGLATRLLGREVAGGSEDRSGSGQRVVAGRRRDAEVGHVDARRRRRGGGSPASRRGARRRSHARGRARPRPARATRAPAHAAPGPRADARAPEPPSRYSMTMNGRPRCSPTSKTVTTFGADESRAAASASRRNRARTSSWRAYRSESSLTATVRSSTESVARYTSPMPPRAMSSGDAYLLGRTSRGDTECIPAPSRCRHPV